MNTCWTFCFDVNPELNGGYPKAFNQGGEPWWWVVTPDGPAAGDVDLTGAVCTSVFKDTIKVWEANL